MSAGSLDMSAGSLDFEGACAAPIDALGWIALDEGGRVRVGGTAMKGFGGSAPIGMRVEVMGTAPGFRGVLKAVEVRPLDPPPPAPPRPQPEVTRVAWPDFVREHPRWSDIADLCVPCARPAPRPELPRQPPFDPWRAEILATAPTVVDLHVPHDQKRDPIEPTAADSFACGRVAFLDEPGWPSCDKCGLQRALDRDVFTGDQGDGVGSSTSLGSGSQTT
jgi:hypothetical protein